MASYWCLFVFVFECRKDFVKNQSQTSFWDLRPKPSSQCKIHTTQRLIRLEDIRDKSERKLRRTNESAAGNQRRAADTQTESHIKSVVLSQCQAAVCVFMTWFEKGSSWFCSRILDWPTALFCQKAQDVQGLFLTSPNSENKLFHHPESKTKTSWTIQLPDIHKLLFII